MRRPVPNPALPMAMQPGAGLRGLNPLPTPGFSGRAGGCRGLSPLPCPPEPSGASVPAGAGAGGGVEAARQSAFTPTLIPGSSAGPRAGVDPVEAGGGMLGAD